MKTEIHENMKSPSSMFKAMLMINKKLIEQINVLNVQLVNCFRNIQNWKVEYYLQLNPGKTQILLVAPVSFLNQISIRGVQLSNGTCVRFISSTKDLGIRIDEHLTFEPQVRALKKVYLRLRQVV
jgi:hypothetical protein